MTTCMYVRIGGLTYTYICRVSYRGVGNWDSTPQELRKSIEAKSQKKKILGEECPQLRRVPPKPKILYETCIYVHTLAELARGLGYEVSKL